MIDRILVFLRTDRTLSIRYADGRIDCSFEPWGVRRHP